MAWTPGDDSFHATMLSLSSESCRLQEKSNNHQIFNVFSKLKEFQAEGKLCDIVIHVQNSMFNAHRAVLAAWSAKLASVITLQEDLASDIVIEYNDANAFAACLEYMYSDVIAVTDINVVPLLELGQSLMMQSLVTVCEEHLCHGVDLNSFIQNYFLGVKYGLKRLEETVTHFIKMNLAVVIEQSVLLDLSPADFKFLLTCGKMCEMQPEVKFSLVISWVGYDLTLRDRYILHLCDQISWTHSVTDLLNQINCLQNIFTTHEFCLFQLLHSLVKGTGHHLGPFVPTYPRLYSMYSQLLGELTCPKAFLVSSQFAQAVTAIPVSALIRQAPLGHRVNMVDVEVNTEVDSSYFQDKKNIPDIEPAQTNAIAVDAEQSCDAVESVATESVDETLPGNVLSIALVDAEQRLTNSECLQINSKHRRKNLPRKITQDGENKGRRRRGRPKKKIKEVIESIGDAESVKNTDLVTTETNGTATKETLLDDEQSVKECVGDIVKKEIKEDFVEIKLSDGTVEIKPAVKLSIKLKRDRCSKHFKNNRSVKVPSRIISKTSTPKLTCDYNDCGYTTHSQHVLENHIARVHNICVQLNCRQCDFVTNEMRDLCQHVKLHFPKPPYYCGVGKCLQKFLRIGLLIRHQMSHMNEKPYKCDMCTKTFATYNQLSCHKKLHEGRQYECDVCMKKFTTKGVMQQHRAIHFDSKPYLCDTCGFSTKHLSHLISHRKIHTGEVLRCTFPNCGYTTPKQGHMTQHINSHLNIRNHICQVCGKSFVVRGKLLRHERIHLKEKLFKCKQCDYQTSRTDRMKLHIESHGIKFKKKKFNIPIVEDEGIQEIDFHQLYEKVQPSDLSQNPNDSLTSQNLCLSDLTIADMKPMDVISFAASTSLIVDSYGQRLISVDPLTNDIETLNDDHNATEYQQSFDRMQSSFDNL